MWNALKSLLPKPPTPNERFWRVVFRGLESDARLLADGLELANRRSAGSWAIMLIECEIAALRASAGCGFISEGRLADAETLIQDFEKRFGTWLEQEREQPLASYSIFSRKTLPDAISSLCSGWRLYFGFINSMDQVSDETFLNDFVALFWGRCVKGYTNQDLTTFVPRGDQLIDRFIFQYLPVQLNLAKP